MNIFVTNPCPILAATSLPEKHIVKMPLETAQMLSIICSPWYKNWGPIPKKDGTHFKTKRGAYRNHPCTVWAASADENLAWLICHGAALTNEYSKIYGKEHGSHGSIIRALNYFTSPVMGVLPAGAFSDVYRLAKTCTRFVRAMPDDLKHNPFITDFEAYQRYISTKAWAHDNYKRNPSRKPAWLT